LFRATSPSRFSSFSCKIGRVPFIYLGLPIGSDARRLLFWKPIIDRIKARLSEWKRRFLSFEGRLNLIKFVLSSLHVYALSFFRAPSAIISSLKSTLFLFFWVGVRIIGNFFGLIGIELI